VTTIYSKDYKMNKYLNAKIGSKIKTDTVTVLCKKTTGNHNCGYCSFGEKTDNCPLSKLLPACFASERTDRQSVYFPFPKIKSTVKQ